MLELEATNTHLYPGAKGVILGDEAHDGPLALRFADGGSAAGRLSGGTLFVDPHTTVAGTRIAAKAWRIAFDGGGFRVTGRAMG